MFDTFVQILITLCDLTFFQPIISSMSFSLPTETLRKYPTIHLSRVCTKDYKIPDTNVTIKKGNEIIIPTLGLHYDEKFYPNPKKFDPTRFDSENKIGKTMVDMPYFPFGEGPRICYGLKIAKMAAKMCMISILQKYHVELDDRHIGKELKFYSMGFT